jgi:hypothetical protein
MTPEEKASKKEAAEIERDIKKLEKSLAAKAKKKNKSTIDMIGEQMDQQILRWLLEKRNSK